MAKEKTAATKAAAKKTTVKKSKSATVLTDMLNHDPKNREVRLEITSDSIRVTKEATGICELFKPDETQIATDFFYHLVECSQN